MDNQLIRGGQGGGFSVIGRYGLKWVGGMKWIYVA